jgi:hypothetical protein
VRFEQRQGGRCDKDCTPINLCPTLPNIFDKIDKLNILEVHSLPRCAIRAAACQGATIPASIAITVPAAQVAVVSEDWATRSLHPPAQQSPIPPSTVALTDERIKLAVSDALAAGQEKAQTPANRQEAQLAMSADSGKDEFAKKFADAKVPSCLGMDGLKFQPPVIGPIVFGGIFAIPFAVTAKLRGKCK